MKKGRIPINEEPMEKIAITIEKPILEWLDNTTGKRERSSKINFILKKEMLREKRGGIVL